MNVSIESIVEYVAESGGFTMKFSESGFEDLRTFLRKSTVRKELSKDHGILVNFSAIDGGSLTLATSATLEESDSDIPLSNLPAPEQKLHHSYVSPKLVKDLKVIMTDAVSHLVQLVGPTGCGKTTLVHQIGKMLSRPVFKMNCRGDMSSEVFIGENTIVIDDETGQNKIVHRAGLIEKAMVEGIDENGEASGPAAILFIDEITACPAHIAHTLNVLFEGDDNSRTLVVDNDGGRIVKSHPDFRIVVAGNTIGRGAGDMSDSLYAAQQDSLDISLLDRVDVKLRMGYDKKAERAILLEKTGDASETLKMLAVRDSIRAKIKSGALLTPFSTRHIIRIADMYRIFGSMAKAIELTVLEGLPSEEVSVYNEAFYLHYGENLVSEVEDDIDYM